MTTSYQTVIFHKPTGEILTVHSNLYISSKKHLARLAGRPHWKDTGFIYFSHDLEIIPGKHSVRSLSQNFPPSLVTQGGIPIAFDFIIQERRAALDSGVNCLVEFEGGMGDQLMEAAAVLTAIKTYPKSSFSIRCKDIYVNILRSIPGISTVQSSYAGRSGKNFTFTVSNHTSYISDPRGGKFGKSSLYGAWLGLDKVSTVSKIKLSQSHFKLNSDFFSRFDLNGHKHNFMCQFRSGSGHGKSWQGEKVVKLAELLKSNFDCNFFVVGSPRELTQGLPHITDLTGGSTWWETCLLVSKMDLVFCIDSGVMHLARSLRIPYIALWGGTNAGMILGEDEQDLDIRLPLDCYDLVCYDCQLKTNACMQQITPDMVLHNARLLLHNSDSKQPRS